LERRQMSVFNEPEGAIWIHDFQMKEQILNAVNSKLTTCPKCTERFFPAYTGLDISVNKKHTLSVKINRYKEKYIAIENSRKIKTNQPDYFIHVQYTHTGSDAIHPFRDSGSIVEVKEGDQPVKWKKDSLRTGGVETAASSGVSDRRENISKEPESNKTN